MAVPGVFDHFDAALRKLGATGCHEPLHHVFTPGLYTRTITMRTGLAILSKIHRTEHPFLISAGVVDVYEAVGGCMRYCETLRAPHLGVTLPGTQRALFIREQAVWSTFHCTDAEDFAHVPSDDPAEIERVILARIEARLIEPHTNPLLEDKPMTANPIIENVKEDEDAAQQFAACLLQARGVVAGHRAKAPEGCDPQNTFGFIAYGVFDALATTAVAIGGVTVAAVGAGLSYSASQSAASQQSQLALMNAQSQTQSVTEQGQLGQMQAEINTQLAANDRRMADENASALLKEADINSSVAQQNMQKTREDFRRLQAAQRVGAAHSGVLDTTGSPYDLLLDTATKEQQQVDKQNYDAEVQRRQTLAASADASNQGVMAEISGLSQQSRGAAAIGSMYQGVAQANLNYLGQQAQADATRNQATGALISSMSGSLNSAYGLYRTTPPAKTN
ncbi:MAG: hypothetical protein JWO94_683 [Verrucomicrobiaceae bacterium]|nr:hypothetical protein [Verrucomicrobiaceae bacterium]